MKNLIFTFLIGLVASLFSNVVAANPDVGIHKVLVIKESKTSTIFSFEGNLTVISPGESFLLHVFVSPERQRMRPLDEKYVDPYLLKLPKHYLLPQKNEVALSHILMCRA